MKNKLVGSVLSPVHLAKTKQEEQSQEEFIAGITHEMRSPLTAINMALYLLAMEKGLGDGPKNMLNAAMRNSERLGSIITDILDFSRLRSGRLVFRLESVSVEEIIKEASDAMKAWATSKGISLSLAAEPGLGRVYADKRRTVQILINLISNAIKFTPSGGAIEVGACSGTETLAGFIFFLVKDNGCGIEKEDQGRIFEKYTQVGAGEQMGGAGLGLAVTKDMALMQGGSITVESEPSKGATFRVSLPVYRGQLERQVPDLEKSDKTN
ncbi:MAG TPA: hypothetical protein DCL44_03500 [Elusimicrobia bacterium]|nr:hypothetical protein [Elusimicrobiota bacterium]